MKLKELTETILNDLDFRRHKLADPCEIGIVLTSDKEIQKLNKKFRNKDKATDVLSFSMIEDRHGLKENPALGDIVISLDSMVRQAKEYNVNRYQELLRLLIHGILHLAGYDHEMVSVRKANAMRRLEDDLYTRYLKLSRTLIG